MLAGFDSVHVTVLSRLRRSNAIAAARRCFLDLRPEEHQSEEEQDGGAADLHGATVTGVTILAPLNLPATMPLHASLLFSRNLTAFVQAFTKDKAFQLDLNDDIQRGALITHEGEVRHARTLDALKPAGA